MTAPRSGRSLMGMLLDLIFAVIVFGVIILVCNVVGRRSGGSSDSAGPGGWSSR